MKSLLNRAYYFLRSYFHSRCSYLIFFVTSRCNARCKMCFYWKEIDEAGRRKELSLLEVESIAKNFKYLAYLSIGGGEPALREDLDKIVHCFYKYSGTRFATFSTNGLLPERTEEKVLSILQKCPDLGLKVYVSIDHIRDKHDDIRGVKGAFEKAIETISRLKKIKKKYSNNLSVCVETVLSGYNKDSIFGIIDYIREGISPDIQSICLARGDTREKGAKSVSVKEYKEAIDYLKNHSERKKGLMRALLRLMREIIFKTLTLDKMVLPCLSGKKMLTLTEEGFIAPCEMLKQIFPERDSVMGSLKANNYDINAIYKSRKYKEILNFIKESRCYCSFECAILCNIVFNPRMYPGILSKVF